MRAGIAPDNRKGSVATLPLFFLPLAGPEADFYRRQDSHERARQDEQTRLGASLLTQGVRVLRCEDWLLDTALIWGLLRSQKIYADNRRQTQADTNFDGTFQQRRTRPVRLVIRPARGGACPRGRRGRRSFPIGRLVARITPRF